MTSVARIESGDGDGRLEALIGRAAIERALAPLEDAAGLPNAAFTSEAFFALEQERLFARSWVLAGFDRDLPQPGDLLPVTVAGAPIILARDKAGAIKAFHNACRHRGARLVAEACSGRNRITCPYHAWAYDLDGRLVARPFFDGTTPKAQALPAPQSSNLVPVRLSRWLDMLFVNLSGDAPPLEACLQPMTARLAGYDLSALRHAGTLEFTVASNWKFACENYIENYHVFAAHPKLARFSPMQARSPGAWDGLCFANHYDFAAPEAGRGAGLPHYPDLPAELRARGLWFLFFPTLGLEVWPDQFAVFRVIPEAPARTREEIHVYLIGEAASDPRHGEARGAVLEMWRELNLEDLGLLEALQAGRRSPSYAGGVYSRQWEGPCHGFARHVVEMLS